MALIHEELYSSQDLQHIDFSHYVQKLADSLHRTYVADPEKVQLHFELDRTPLPVDTVIPCGLILTELLTNAFKHAFPANKKGDVTIRLKPRDTNSYFLTVQDNGVGIPLELDLEKPPSLGLKLVSILVEQLHGDMKVDNKGGTRFVISFHEYREAGTTMF